MMKTLRFKKLTSVLKASIILLIILIGMNLIVGCGWIIYLDRGYHGTVIDADTKEPIEGAVVVAIYSAGCARPVEGYSKTLGARETWTDANGDFQTSLFWTVSSPNCFKSFTNFTVFKGGYGYSLNAYLLHLPGYIPSDRYYNSIEVEDMFRKGVVVELPRLTREERRNAMPDMEWEFREDMPKLIKAVDTEDKYLKEKAPSQATQDTSSKPEVVVLNVRAVHGAQAVLVNVKTREATTVRVGDRIGGSTVVQITPLLVELEREGDRGMKLRAQLPVPQPVPPPSSPRP